MLLFVKLIPMSVYYDEIREKNTSLSFFEICQKIKISQSSLKGAALG
jgi:hypothetical protein